MGGLPLLQPRQAVFAAAQNVVDKTLLDLFFVDVFSIHGHGEALPVFQFQELKLAAVKLGVGKALKLERTAHTCRDTRQYGEIAREYRDFPALRGYDIWNETQFTSFDKYTLERFRSWLRDKYHTLDALNASWNRAYRSWEQVRFTQWMWSSVMTFVDYS